MDAEVLVNLIDKGYTQREIASELELSQTSVRHWLVKFDLKTKNRKTHRDKVHLCRKCGTFDETQFYGNDKEVCAKCHNERVKESGREKRKYAIEKLGGKCVHCGFDKYDCSLDVHHIDPKKKDVNFKSMRGWSLQRIDREIEHCVLLCKNCHAAYHNGDIDQLNGL